MRALLPVAALTLVAGCGASLPAAHTTGGSSPTVSTSSSSSTSPTAAAPRQLVVRTLPWRLPTPLGREAVVAVGDRLLVAGGLVAGDQSTAVAYRLDPTTGHVQPLRSLPVPVHDTAGVLLGGSPVVIGGGNASEQDVVQVRHPGGWTLAGHLPQTRSDLSAFTVGDRAIVLGGYDAVSPAVPSVLASRDGVSWTVIGSLPEPVRYAAGVVQGGAVWLFGGERSGAQQTAVQRIEPATGTARVVAHLPHPLGHASAIALGGRILLLGGRTGSSSMTSQMWWFDPATHHFTKAGKLPVPLADAGVGVVGGVAYVVGGESPAVTDHVLAVTLR
jgi:N-acetylneuraminic acid mutarotase